MTSGHGPDPCAYVSRRLFDGTKWHSDTALVVAGGAIAQLVAAKDLSPELERHNLASGVIAPGFVDLQVNGGGGVMFNDATTPEGLGRIAAAHARLGATSILPTLITDTRDKTIQAIKVVRGWVNSGAHGILGLHLEGPHLSAAKKGAHDGQLIRRMDKADLKILARAAQDLPVLAVTIAPEAVSLDQISALAGAGVVVCLGHSDSNYEACVAAQRAGARGVTHLFNAMRQIGPRDPGVVGAALTSGGLSAGLIADGIHVHPANIAMAMSGKSEPGKIYLVSDAMATAGSDITTFTLNGRQITRSQGRLTLGDGTLAGADLDLARAVRVMTGQVGVPLGRALAMATSIPADFIGQGGVCGHLSTGQRADFIHLDDDGALVRVWQGGRAL